MEYPQQQTAAEILGQQGRRKAQFLASTILQYIRHPNDPDDSANSIGIDMRTMLEVLQSAPYFSTGGHVSKENNQKNSDNPAISWDEPPLGSALAAVSNTLAAFRSK